MTSLEAILRRVDADLAQARVSFALIGGLAVSARTEPRFTRDADLVDLAALLGAASDADLERARHALGLIAAKGYDRGRDLLADMDGLVSARSTIDGDSGRTR